MQMYSIHTTHTLFADVTLQQPVQKIKLFVLFEWRAVGSSSRNQFGWCSSRNQFKRTRRRIWNKYICCDKPSICTPNFYSLGPPLLGSTPPRINVIVVQNSYPQTVPREECKGQLTTRHQDREKLTLNEQIQEAYRSIIQLVSAQIAKPGSYNRAL